MNEPIVFSVSDFVAVFNQTIEYAYPVITIEGELSNFKISKGKWLYFDLKDDQASVRFFGTIYSLPGPLEDGMMVRVVGAPRLHQTFGFSISVQIITPVGEGSLKKAADLLRAKLTKEGLFAPERKRYLPHPPARIGLVASGESAAYADFMKILNARWGGVEVVHAESQVQGELAIGQIVSALDRLNETENLDVIVITRGGGSADDLSAFSTEQVVRAVAASRIPTLVAIGHEVDESLAELAADVRASTPSNAAELLVPDRSAVVAAAHQDMRLCLNRTEHALDKQRQYAKDISPQFHNAIDRHLALHRQWLAYRQQHLGGYNPALVLRRGYAILRHQGLPIKRARQLKAGDAATVELADGSLAITIDRVY